MARARLIALSAVLLGLVLAPASAQAQEGSDRSGRCTATLTAERNEDNARLTITCDGQRITGAEFRTSENATLVGGFRTNQPPQGLSCQPPAGRRFECGGEIRSGVRGAAELGTDDPCGNDFRVRDLALDTGRDEDDSTVQRDIEFQTLEVSCVGSTASEGVDPGTDNGGGGSSGGGQSSGSSGGDTEQCLQSEGGGDQEIVQNLPVRDRGERDVLNLRGGSFGGDSGGSSNLRCVTDGGKGGFDGGRTPKGGIDSGAGGAARSSAAVPLWVGAGALVGILALTGVAVRRRLSS